MATCSLGGAPPCLTVTGARGGPLTGGRPLEGEVPPVAASAQGRLAGSLPGGGVAEDRGPVQSVPGPGDRRCGNWHLNCGRAGISLSGPFNLKLASLQELGQPGQRRRSEQRWPRLAGKPRLAAEGPAFQWP